MVKKVKVITRLMVIGTTSNRFARELFSESSLHSILSW